MSKTVSLRRQRSGSWVINLFKKKRFFRNHQPFKERWKLPVASVRELEG